MGTLYRHFPTKEALFEAIVVGRMELLVEEARAGARARDPGAAFFGFLTRMVEEGAAKKDFLNALAGTGVDLHRVATKIKQHMTTTQALAVLLERAQAASAARGDVTAIDVLTLVMGIVGRADGHGSRGRRAQTASRGHLRRAAATGGRGASFAKSSTDDRVTGA